MSIENAIIVKSKTRLEMLTEKFNTKKQAEFYIVQNMMTFKEKRKTEAPKSEKSFMKNVVQQQPKKKDEQNEGVIAFKSYQEEHDQYYRTFESVQSFLSKHLKVNILERQYLPSYIFTEKDLVIVVGQDGLVANTAKYVNNIPIIGINPDPKKYDGILLPFDAKSMQHSVLKVLGETYSSCLVTMAEVKLNDGQRLLAFNDIFLGPSSHTSARYNITFNGNTESHSSSGLIVSTGAGSTGWLSSVFNMANGIGKTFIQPNSADISPLRVSWDENKLVFVVREPFRSKNSQVNLSAGTIEGGNELILESLMPDNGIIFSDGIEADSLKFNSGSIATIGIAPEKAKLVIAL